MPDRLPETFYNWLVELRRWFHRFPEPAYREEKTAAKICEVLDSLGIPFQAGIGKTGIVAKLSAQRSGPVVAFRCDMDALPLEEAHEAPYKSEHHGCMHACGHDGHMTIALGVIRWMLEKDWPQKGAGEILFIFQPAEEGGAGAKAMLNTGIFDSLPVEAAFAGHLYPELAAGDIGIAPIISNAATDTFTIRLQGKGGHGAHPHQCKDPIVAGAHLVTQLQTLISRELPPLDSAVLTIGRFEAGTASNIIPEEAFLEGTLRTLIPEIREKIIVRFQQMVKGVEMSHDVTATLQVTPGYPVLVNDPLLVKHTQNVAAEVLGGDHVHSLRPRMGAEDFAYFCNKWGGIMVGLGCHDPNKGMQHGLHSPYFDFDETVLDIGTRLFGQVLKRYLEKSTATAA
jgi:amidohydrolase